MTTTNNAPPASLLGPPAPAAIRAEVERLIVGDLLGPAGGEHETLPGTIRVRDRYLVGLIAPKGTIATVPERSDDQTPLDDADLGAADPLAASPALYPSAIGLSFAVVPGATELRVTVAWGHYVKVRNEEEKGTHWQREPVEATLVVALRPGTLGPFTPVAEQDGVQLRGRAKRTPNAWLIDLFLVNEQATPKQNRDSAWLFQPRLAVESSDGAPVFIGRREAAPGSKRPTDQEDQALDLLYRDEVEFAVGHSVAVHCDRAADPERAVRVETSVLPVYEVARTDAPSAEDAPDLAALELDMQLLAQLEDAALVTALLPLADAYDHWLDRQEECIGAGRESLGDHEAAAREAIRKAREMALRLRAGITLLGADAAAAEAFRFANRAMWLQRVQGVAAARRREDPTIVIEDALREADVPAQRSWRPFQLAFICVNLPALTDPRHPERQAREGLADLLFFPTGGGKTEAYLGLTAFTLAIRRLQGVVADHDGSGGVAVLMRYTLRLLTAQQFQRATGLICACELIRRERVAKGDQRLGETPFRIGMWVGGGVTPNKVADATRAVQDAHGVGGMHSGRAASPLQLTSCPWCGTAIDPARHLRVDSDLHRVLVFCGDPLGACPFTEARNGEGIPVLTTDEEIYRLLPALVIATADKFAQLPWQGPLQLLFGKVARRCTRHGYRTPDLDDWVGWGERDSHTKTARLPAATSVACAPLRPPDLIIQDELHLIAGPLGTLMGLYETAIDALCAWPVDGREVRPKIVASTATIRRAGDQVNAIFWRKVAVFPPQVLDIGASFFAVQRPLVQSPGRRYLGICAPGQRLKAVEIRVFVAALAAAQVVYERYGVAADPWMTLVGYFNALRELGGMRRLITDDVASRLRTADQHGLAARRIPNVQELTSRVGSSGIPRMLEDLGLKHDPGRAKKNAPQPIDVLLATNMISVGVDVPRLGLMTVVGQPKATAEYIQATSRVGRDRSGPGLVLTIYNWARPRDLSHYESFEQYHATFYRQVEALSVTPFATRALDRGLSALMVTLIRQSRPQWNPNAAARDVDLHDEAIKRIEAAIARRASDITGDRAVETLVHDQVQARADDWQARQRRQAVQLSYRSESGDALPLLQQPSLGAWEMWTCPMSLREVESNINLILNQSDLSVAGAPAFGPAFGEPALPELDDDQPEEDAEEDATATATGVR